MSYISQSNQQTNQQTSKSKALDTLVLWGDAAAIAAIIIAIVQAFVTWWIS